MWRLWVAFLCVVHVAVGCCKDEPSEMEVELVREYNTISMDLRDKTYPRVPGSVPGQVEDGAASDLYQQAHRKAQGLRFDSDRALEIDGMISGEKALTPDGSQALSAACVEAGFPAGSKDPVALRLDDELCRAMVAAKPALAALFKASRASDARSPYHPWDAWSVDSEGRPKNVMAFLELAQLNNIIGHGHALRGERGQQLDAKLAMLRAGQDLGRQAPFIPALVGSAMMMRTLPTLRKVALSSELGEAELVRVLEGLIGLDMARNHTADIIVAELLLETRAIFFFDEPEGLLAPPTAIYPKEGNSGEDLLERWRKRGWKQAMSMKSLRQANVILRARDAPLAKRFGVYNAAEEHSWFHYSAKKHSQYDALLTVVDTHVRMLGWAVAIKLFEVRQGKAPASLEAVRTVHKGLAEDLLTQSAFVLASEGGRVKIQSAAADRYRDLFIGETEVKWLSIDLNVNEGPGVPKGSAEED